MVEVTGLNAIPIKKNMPNVQTRARITDHTPRYISRGFDLQNRTSEQVLAIEGIF